MNFSPKQISKIPEIAGVYFFQDAKAKILYIGKAKNLKKRVSSYFLKDINGEFKTKILISQIFTIEIIPVESEFEALLLEASLIKKNKPKYNVIWKDDKHYIYIKITKEEFPRILFCRRDMDKKAIYFGPFPSKKIVREILYYIRSIFPYCTQKKTAKRACFYFHLGLCNPCPFNIRKKEGEAYLADHKLYHKNITRIKTLLEGKLAKVHFLLKKQMGQCSDKKQFEQAAKIRDKIEKLDWLVNSYRPASAYLENPDLIYDTWKNEQKELFDLLKKYFPKISPIKRIECYDISNISGKFAVGSMVVFVDGKPAKNFYRRFRIKTVKKQNDFSMLSEIIDRRFSHKEWILPDLFVLDGGRPQLSAVKKIFLQKKTTISLIGLAKREEELVIPKQTSFIKVKLPRKSKALHLVQRLRDEAHRFAHRYHELLRLKYLMASVD